LLCSFGIRSTIKVYAASSAVDLRPSLKVVYSTGLPVTDDLKALLVPGSVILEKPYTVESSGTP
jgi:hypothetical protein